MRFYIRRLLIVGRAFAGVSPDLSTPLYRKDSEDSILACQSQSSHSPIQLPYLPDTTGQSETSFHPWLGSIPYVRFPIDPTAPL